MFHFQLEAMEKYSRRNCLLIGGAPELPEESTDDLVLELVRAAGVALTLGDLDRSHRLGRRSGSVDRPRHNSKTTVAQQAAAVLRCKKGAVGPQIWRASRPNQIRFEEVYRRSNKYLPSARPVRSRQIGSLAGSA